MIYNKAYYTSKDFNWFFYVVAVFFWLGQFYGSSNFIDIAEQVRLSPGIHYFFVFPIGKIGFSPLQLSTFLLATYPLVKFSKLYSLDKEFLKYFVIFCVIILFVFINPNNNFRSAFLLDGEARNFLLFLFVLYSFLFLESSMFTQFIKKLFIVGVYVFFITTSLELFKFMLGKASFWQGQQRVILQYDILIWITFFQVFFWGLYLIYSKKIYLFMSFFYMVVLIFSLSRGSLWLAIFSCVIIFLACIYKTKKIIGGAFRILLFSFILILFLIWLDSMSFTNLDYIKNRYLSVFIYFNDSFGSYNTKFHDNGHIEQSINVTMILLNKFDIFWGAGLGNRPFLVAGAYQSGQHIHNSFIFAWAKHGLFMTLYIIYILYISFKMIIKNLKKQVKQSNKNYILFQLFIYILLFLFVLSGWSTGLVRYLLSDIIAFSQFLMLFIVIKIDEQSYYTYIESKV